jgi:serine/threonine protein kinase
LRELRFLLSLEHPNIANCTALEQSATGRQLVLDYCEAGTLRQLMEQSAPVSLAEILTWVAQVLEALDHAHSQGIVHCDIKPENILLGIVPGAWQVKISDFGIARLSQELRTQGISGATGSPAYMAPERFYHQYSAASDLYAVGVILFELVMGERPFTGTPKPAHGGPSQSNFIPIPEDLPDPLQDFLRKALQKLVARRYRTAVAMKTALATLRDSLSVAELGQRYPRIYRHGSPPVPFALQTYAPLAYPVQWGAID